MLKVFILSVVLTLILTVLFSKKFIPALISRKMGQPILEIGPRWHKSKEGTPTMGGLFFIAAIFIVGILFSFFVFPKEDLPRVWITLGMAAAFGAVGFIDDRAKLLKKQNEGLRAYQKFLFQVIVAAAYLFLMTLYGGLDTKVIFPFLDKTVDFGIAYYGFAIILIVGVNNSVNLTDGIDGLCASVTATVAAFFAVCGFRLPTLLSPEHASDPTLAVLAGMTFGACIGFLVYNWNPARVFMGDTGSLFLGGMVAGLAFLLNVPLVILVVGLFYVIEAASVILQVGFFKLTHGKRLFKMAPIHHHFEKCGWSEPGIAAFGILLTAVIAVFSYCFL
ncbi:MAG: phospho-N-acetylmuramoyl-pentapeptide-transferase [Clostridiales bacterium]|nr:MAG: phospho-N-acetylmuramoyl-pentapeptide-transferase [Clostridiales bacterium]